MPNNPYKAPVQKAVEISKREEIEQQNRKKRKLFLLITISFGLVCAVVSIDKDAHYMGNVLLGMFCSLLVGVPLLFVYVFTKKR